MNERTLTTIILTASIAVPAIVAALFFIKVPVENLPFDIHLFPRFHAILNGTTACCLIGGFFFIKSRNIKAHRLSMLFAFILSAVFLISYVTYHSIAESTKYGGDGLIRYFYYVLLISHILLATTILPLILFTFARALQGKLVQHKKLAKWTLPLWLYVAISGVLVYIMISPYYI